MLSLLTPEDAAYIVYYLSKKQDWQLSFRPENKLAIQSDQKEFNQLLMFRKLIENAIQADELPAKKIPLGKPADKKVFEKLNIPPIVHDSLTQYDYWITQEDLFVFIERPSVISKDYAHGRDALARLLCALIGSDNKLNDKDIFTYLADKIVNAEVTIHPDFKLGDNTLKGCCREVLDTYSTIKNSNSEK